MKVFIALATSLMVTYQGCKSETATTTTAAPKTTTTTPPSTLPTCGKKSGKGYMTISTVYDKQNFKLSGFTCDKYPKFNDLLSLKISELPQKTVAAFISAFDSNKAKVRVVRKILDNDTLTSDIKKGDYNPDQLKSGLNKILSDPASAEVIYGLVAKPDEDPKKLEAEELISRLKENPVGFGFLLAAYILDTKMTDFYFQDCSTVLEVVGSMFRIYEVDSFCDPKAAALDSKATCALEAAEKFSALDLARTDSNGWKVTGAKCEDKDSDVLKTAMTGLFAEITSGSFLADVAFHRASCDELATYGGLWLLAIASSVCYEQVPAECWHKSHSKTFSLHATYDRAAYRLKHAAEKSAGGAAEGAAETSDPDANSQRLLAEEKKETKHFTVKTMECEAYPTFMADVSALMEFSKHPKKDEEDKDASDTKTLLRRLNYDVALADAYFPSCVAAAKAVSEVLKDVDLDSFCDPAAKTASATETETCVVTDEDKNTVNLSRAEGTWSITDITCGGVSNAEALASAGGAFDSYEAGTPHGDSIHRQTCTYFQTKITRVDPCYPDTTTTSGPTSSTTYAPSSTTTGTGAGTTAAADTTAAPARLLL